MTKPRRLHGSYPRRSARIRPVNHRLQLLCHPATPCAISLAITAEVWPSELGGETALRIQFEVTGEVGRLLVPPPALTPAPADGLWQHTCFEAFVGRSQGAVYEEFNFSPSGHWAHYAFENERQREGSGHSAGMPVIQMESSPTSLKLSARAACSGQQAGQPSAVGICAVIELTDGSLSYWALHHAKDRPDFHDRLGWTLSL